LKACDVRIISALVAVAQLRTASKGAQQKEQAMTTPKTSANYRPRRNPFLSGAAAPRHVVFPHNIVPLFVGREKSIRALEEVMKTTRWSCWRRRRTRPTMIRLQRRSTRPARLRASWQLLKLPDAPEGAGGGPGARACREIHDRSEYYEATAVALADTNADSVEAKPGAFVVSDFESYVKLNKKISAEVVAWFRRSPISASSATTSPPISPSRSRTARPSWRRCRSPRAWKKVLGLMESEISVLQVEKRIRSRVKRQMEKTSASIISRADEGDPEGARRRRGPGRARRSRGKISKTKLSKEARERRSMS